MKNLTFLFVFLISTNGTSLFSDSFTKGKELFESNDVALALEYFEDALAFSKDVEVFKYLAESYSVLGLFEDAVLVLEEAIYSDLGEKSYFHFKLGNAYYSLNNYKSALDNYLEVITLKGDFIQDSFLNVANVAVELGLYQVAIDNYSKFIELAPNDPQRRKIARLILLLRRALRDQEEEALKIAKSEEDINSEKDRLDAEAKSLQAEIDDLKAKEELVVDPPDPEIEDKKLELAKKEEELRLWEESIKRMEEELEAERLKFSTMQEETPPVNVTDNVNGLEEPEDLRHKAIMSDILKSLEKIGENAKTIGASSEDVIDNLEGSNIDE